MKKAFSHFGDIKVLTVPPQKGFAIITFYRIEDAQAALSMNMKTFEGKPIHVMESKSSKIPETKERREDDRRDDRRGRSRSRSRSPFSYKDKSREERYDRDRR